jgi:hypothetical protein
MRNNEELSVSLIWFLVKYVAASDVRFIPIDHRYSQSFFILFAAIAAYTIDADD